MPTTNPKSRRKAADKLHSVSLKLWITEPQEKLLVDLADRRDIPKGVLAREAMLLGLDAFIASMNKQDKAA